MTNLTSLPKLDYLKTNRGNQAVNQYLITIEDKTTIFYSYNQPIFAYDSINEVLIWFVCADGKGSVTTDKYTYQALRCVGLMEIADRKSLNKAIETGKADIGHTVAYEIEVKKQYLEPWDWK